MRALVWRGPRAMGLQEVAEPSPAPGECVLSVRAVGICGSELSGYLGENSLRQPPLVMGHEFVANVETEVPGGRWHAGQRVVVNPMLYCGACAPCRGGQENLCRERRIIGAARAGAFAERVAVPETCCHAVSGDLPDAVAAMAEPLACAVRAVEVGRPRLGDTVLILGAGAIGLLTLAVARRGGAGVVAVADVSAERLSNARAWGATHALDGGGDVAAEVRRLTGRLGADLAVDAVGVAATRRTAVRAVRPGGRVVLIGLHEPESALPLNEVVREEVAVTGSFCYRRRTFERALALLAEGLLQAGPWQEERPLEAGPDAFEELLAGRVAASKVVLTP